MKKIVLVDKKDKIVGYGDKEKCHQGEGILHRACIVFVFNQNGQLLIQKRSKLKKLWPLFWDNSCSSHPQKGETYLKTIKRRLKEELGFSCQPKFVDKFQYQARYKNIGSENEVCAVFVGKYNGKIKPNPKEIANWKWVELREFKKDIIKNPNRYTPWLKIGLTKI
jgi:isopentenyl-diphosphate delta-isomerase